MSCRPGMLTSDYWQSARQRAALRPSPADSGELSPGQGVAGSDPAVKACCAAAPTPNRAGEVTHRPAMIFAHHPGSRTPAQPPSSRQQSATGWTGATIISAAQAGLVPEPMDHEKPGILPGARYAHSMVFWPAASMFAVSRAGAKVNAWPPFMAAAVAFSLRATACTSACHGGSRR
jgi:hypothetical protein